jgi:dihydroflavonol-4-reductase
MILITGATGHLGNVLARQLLARGEQVRAMVLPGERCDALNGLDLEIMAGNVLDRDTLDKAMAGVDIVYHLAGVISIVPGTEELMRRVNVEGTANTAAAALQAKVRRMIHVSSIHALKREPHGVIIDEKTPLDPDNPAGAYDRTKAAGTLAVLEAVEQGLDAVVVCPTGIFGPHDYLDSEMGRVIGSFAEKKLHLLVNGAFDFVDARDVARGLILAADKGRRGESYILSGNRVTLENLRDITQKIAGVNSPLMIVPFGVALFFSKFTQHLYRRGRSVPRFTCYSLETVAGNSCFSCAKAGRELGFTARPTASTIADLLAWRKEHYQKHFTGRSRRGKCRLWGMRKAAANRG